MEECRGCKEEKEDLVDAIIGQTEDGNPVWGRVCVDCTTRLLMGEKFI